MAPLRSERGRVSLIPLLAVLVLAIGIALAAWHTRATRTPAPAPPMPSPAASADTGDVPEDAVDRALAQAGDSTRIKSRWVEDLRGVDLAGLEGRQHETVIRFANARRCTCGCGFTLAACRVYDQTCEVSGPLLQALVDSVRAGSLHDLRGIRPRPVGTAPAGG